MCKQLAGWARKKEGMVKFKPTHIFTILWSEVMSSNDQKLFCFVTRIIPINIWFAVVFSDFVLCFHSDVAAVYQTLMAMAIKIHPMKEKQRN